MIKDKMHDGDNYGVTMGTWEVGFCSCFDQCIPNCCMAWCFPCVSLAQISARLGMYKYGKVLVTTCILYVVIIALSLAGNIANMQPDNWVHTVDEYGTYKSWSTNWSSYVEVLEVISGVLGLIYCSFVWMLRSKIRARFEIPGNPCSDCLASCCCSCCAIAQMATHSKSYKPGSCEFGPPDTLPAFK